MERSGWCSMGNVRASWTPNGNRLTAREKMAMRQLIPRCETT